MRRVLRVVALGVGLFAAACAPTTSVPAQPAGGALPAPTPSDVTVRINEAQNGQAVEVAVGQRFAVELVGVPTAGYVWEPAQAPDFITRAGEATGATIAAQNQPGYTGGNHWEVLMFSATASGSGELVIEQRRPWETHEPPSRTFRVTIVAH